MLGYGVIAIVSLVVVGFLVYRAYSFDKTLKNSDAVATTLPVTANLRIDFGENKFATYLAIQVNSPATVLKLIQAPATKDLNLVIEVKPLGTLIKSIAGKTASNGYFWLTYVNGIVTPSGVDSIAVASGDLIEIKYNKL